MLLAACLVLVAGYATLPWWLPASVIRGAVAGDISSQTGLDVNIGHVSVGWSSGVVVSQIQIAAPASQGGETMCTVDSARADFSPLRYLFTGRIGWLELDRPRLMARIDQSGEVNLAPLARIQPKVEIDRISIRQAAVTVKFPGQDRLLRLNVGDMQIMGGRADRIARITMSAELDQPVRPAAVSLNVEPGLSEQATAAEASFRFANVDLGQFNLPSLLGLPLEQLSGRCGGTIRLKLSQQAQVDQVDLSLGLSDLLLQVRGKPPAPAIERIDLSVSAWFDPLTGWLDIRSAGLKMPGLDLAGKFSAGADLRKGSWEALESLQFDGTVEPARLGWLAEQADIAGLPVGVNGPIGVSLLITHSGPAMAVRFSVRADQAAISLKAAPNRPIKPAGTRFSVDLDGSLDERTWNLGIHKSVIRIGQTVFEGKGTVRATKKIAGILSGGENREPPSLADVIGILSQVSWQGRMRLEDVRHIPEVRPELAVLDELLQLDRPIEGELNFDGPAGRKFDANLSLDLKSGRSRDGDHLVLRTSGRIESHLRPLADGLVELSIGKAGIALRDMSMSLADPVRPAGRQAVKAGATLDCGDLAGLVDLLTARQPGLKGLPAEIKISGALGGRLDVQLFGDRDLAMLGLDLAGLDLAFGGWFVKPAGQKAGLDLSLESVNLGGGEPLTASCDVDCLQSRLSASLTSANLGEMAAGRGELKFKLTSADAGSLVAGCPAFRSLPVAVRLAGPFEISGAARLAADDIKFHADLSADGLAAELGDGLRFKRPSMALGAALRATMRVYPGRIALKDARANLTLGYSRIYANVEFGEFPDGSANLMARLHPVKFVDCGGTVNLDEFMLGLLPEARRLAERFNLSASDGIGFGFILGRGASENETDLALRIDADNLSFSKEKITLGELGIAGDPLGLLRFGPVRKYVGQPARAGMFVAVKHALPEAEKNSGTIAEAFVGLNLQLNQARLAIGSGFTPPRQGETIPATSPATRPAAWPVNIAGERFEIGGISGQLVLSGLQSLTAFSPDLAAAALAGGLQAEWVLDPGGTGTGKLDFRFDRLGWRLGGKKIYLDGKLSAADIVLHSPAGSSSRPVSDRSGFGWPGVVRTGGLEFRIGSNRGWLIADLSGWPDRVSGQAAVFIRRLDVMDVQNWLAGGGTDSSGAATQPAGKPRLTFQQKQAIQSQADQAVQTARTYLGQSDLNILLQADSLITYDQDVDRYYEERNLVLRVAVKQGQVRIVSEFGLNGGCDRLVLETKLTDPEPVLLSDTTIRDVIAAENIQPQLAKFFPGNTVLGSFDRTEKVTYLLREMLAQSIDSRVRAVPTGLSKMVAREGYVLGRAAPHFIANIFPGLNLTKYDYKTMTSFGEFFADGTARNDMVFSGQSYDMYMEGTTDANNFAEYEIGVILLGQDADWNHSWKQLRIPILKFRGTIEGGKILNQEVSYFWPTETAFVIFLKNNIVYRLWANITTPAEGKK
ncbi:MAG: hypothetical protein HZA50_02780 [Planctomycetes bacterium]|nr:hypothetical protein [Planctomycetota bacterium]